MTITRIVFFFYIGVYYVIINQTNGKEKLVWEIKNYQ